MKSLDIEKWFNETIERRRSLDIEPVFIVTICHEDCHVQKTDL